MSGDPERKWQEGASRTHYQVTPPLAACERVDNGTQWETESKEKRGELWENERVG